MAGQVEFSQSTGTVAHVGQDGVGLYQARVVRQGLKACKNGMRLNRAYTPTNLMAMVLQITGKKFKLKQYDEAIAAMDAHISAAEAAVPVVVRA